MIIVDNRWVVVSPAEVPMLAEMARPEPASWLDSINLHTLTGLPVYVAPVWPEPALEIPGGWMVICFDDEVYAWNPEHIESALKESLRESSYQAAMNDIGGTSVGLFQQRSWQYFDQFAPPPPIKSFWSV